MAEVLRPFDRATAKQWQCIFAAAVGVGLERGEVRELAEYVLAREVPSFRTVTRDEARRLIDALTGYRAVCTLIDLRPAWKARTRSYVPREAARS